MLGALESSTNNGCTRTARLDGFSVGDDADNAAADDDDDNDADAAEEENDGDADADAGKARRVDDDDDGAAADAFSVCASGVSVEPPAPDETTMEICEGSVMRAAPFPSLLLFKISSSPPSLLLLLSLLLLRLVLLVVSVVG